MDDTALRSSLVLARPVARLQKVWDILRVAAIAKHLLEGCGIRKTSRLVGASKSGVTSVALRIGWPAYALHDERGRGLTVNEVQAYEKWSFVEKKQKHCAEDNEMDAMAAD